MKRSTASIVVIAILLAAGLGWYAVRAGWFSKTEIPNNPPTPDEIRRMEEIVETSSQVAPGATPGAGVFAPGTLPVPMPEEGTPTNDTLEVELPTPETTFE